MDDSSVIVRYLIPGFIDVLLTNLLRQDALYASSDFTQYSLVRINSNYQTFHEAVLSKFPGYSVDAKGVLNNDSDLLMDFHELKGLLT
jgi:hypothetical protein